MPAISPAKYLVQAGWNDVPHLTEQAKRDLLASTPPHLRTARSEGEPGLGSGAIYPIDPAEFTVEPFDLPDYWPKAYGLDVGWNRTAAIWGAIDRSVDTLYLYAEYYRGQAEPPVHKAAIRARGDWIPGVIDPGARGRSQVDGRRLIDQYADLELDAADNAVEAGIYAVYHRMSTGRLKVFRTLQNWFAEFRLYRRDEDGKVVKEFDHAMDASRYLVMSGIKRARTRPTPRAGAMTRAGDRVAGY